MWTNNNDCDDDSQQNEINWRRVVLMRLLFISLDSGACLSVYFHIKLP
jgi:hypothetical protein